MIAKIIKNRLLSAFIIAILLSIILSVIFSIGVFQGWNYRLSDSLYTQKKPLESIVIVAIDDSSLQDIGRWPWPREVFVKTLPAFNESRVIGIDVAFFENYSSVVDKQLGEEIGKLNSVVPVEFTEFEKTSEILHGKGILKPISELQNKSDVGFINIFTDEDGITRTAPLVINAEKSYDSFALKIVKKYLGKNISYAQDPLIINFVGPSNSFRTISFSDVYRKKTDFNFSGRIVLIGATAPDLHDDSVTPTSKGKPMPGVEIHANAMQTLLTRNFLTRQGGLSVIVLIFILAVLTAFLLFYLKFLTATISSAILFAGYFFFAIFLFDRGIILNLVYPFLAILATYLGITVFFYFSEGRERKRIKSLFSKYVSKDVVEEILSKTKSDEINLRGEEKDVTVIFADIRGFTSMSENMKPHDVVAMLNKYLGGMTEPIFDNQGMLDKYIGDCIMAIFGAPLDDKNHALNAIKAAIKMRDKIIEMQKGMKKKVGMGIGINSGEAVIGNMGSKQMANYTAIGDTVNTASRLCSKAEAGQIIISEETYQRIKEHVNAKSLGEITVKGKAKPIKIYDVIGLKN
jgi:adenylate cyclase